MAHESKIHYRPDIDGLRAFAVTFVVLFHAGVALVPSGFVGVDIFFVISGYLIGGIIARDVRRGGYSYAEFYARRAKRILPALIAVVTVSCLFGALIMGAEEFHSLASTSLTALLAFSNISFWHYQDYFAADSRLSPMLMTWSLGVEEQFYFIFPLLLIALMRWAPRYVFPAVLAVAAVSLAYSLWATFHYPSAAYYLLPSRWWELAAGTLIALRETFRGHERDGRSKRMHHLRELLGFGGLAAIVVAATGFSKDTPFPGFLALLPVSGAGALILARGSRLNRFILAAPPVVFIGLISYSWYLWHWPLLSFTHILYLNDAPELALIVAAGISFILAILSWKWIEQPFRHARHPNGRLRLRYGVALALACLLPMVGKFTHGLPQRLPAATNDIRAMLAEGRGNCLADFDSATPDLSPDCVALQPGTKNIAVLGDSHAAAMGPALRELARRQGAGIEILTKSSCPPLLDIPVDRPDHPLFQDACRRFNAAAIKKVTDDPSISTVYLIGYWDAPVSSSGHYVDPLRPENTDLPALFRQGLDNSLQALGPHAHVIVMRDVPRFSFAPDLAALSLVILPRHYLVDMLEQAAGHSFPDATGAATVSPDERIDQILDAERTRPNVDIRAISTQLCAEARCKYMDRGHLLYIDNQHLTKTGALMALGLE